MQKTIDAIFEDGVFKPVKKVNLPEHSKLKLRILSAKEKGKDTEAIARKQSEGLLSLAGIWDSGIQNISEEHDKYLYGTSPK